MSLSSRLLGAAAGFLTLGLQAADDHTGVCAHFDQGWDVRTIMPMIADLGVGWIRDGVPWSDVEPAKHQYQIPPRLTAWLDAAHAEHLHVLLLLGYGNKIYQDPFSPPDYARAAAFLATKLADRIDAIEVLNEPNNPDFGPTYGGKWNGNEDDGSVSPYVRAYAKVLAATVAAVKQANPRMLVVGYGAPAPATFRMMALGAPARLDGITDHPYSDGRRLPEWIPYAATPDLLERDGIATADLEGTYRSQCAMFLKQARKHGLHAALWNTEWGYSTAQPAEPDEKVVTPQAQAVYILRRLLEARALNVMTFYYVFRDDGGDLKQEWQNFGLVDINLKPKPAYFAFQRFTRLFAGLEGDGSSDGYRFAPGQSDSPVRCYAYHRAGSPDRWIACWQVGEFPGAPPAGPVPLLQLPTACTFRHATITRLLDGDTQPLDIGQDGAGHRSCEVDGGSAPVVVHLSN